MILPPDALYARMCEARNVFTAAYLDWLETCPSGDDADAEVAATTSAMEQIQSMVEVCDLTYSGPDPVAAWDEPSTDNDCVVPDDESAP